MLDIFFNRFIVCGRWFASNRLTVRYVFNQSYVATILSCYVPQRVSVPILVYCNYR